MIDLRIGDARALIRDVPDDSIDLCISSPPYFGLRDYGTADWEGGDPDCDHVVETYRIGEGLAKFGQTIRGGGHKAGETPAMQARDICPHCGAQRIDAQMGLEASPDAFIAALVDLYRDIRRTLKPQGVCFINIGDSYFNYRPGFHDDDRPHAFGGERNQSRGMSSDANRSKRGNRYEGIKDKDLIGIPWRLAFALQQPYYIGKIKSKEDRIWLAAIMDGEGSISGFEHDRKDDGRTRTGLNICITNSNMALLDECARIWPGSLRNHVPNGDGHLGQREIMRWLPKGAADKAQLLAELYPHLIAKKRQALVGWNLAQAMIVGKSASRGDGADAFRERRAIMVQMLRDLNADKPVDLPDWIIEPPAQTEQGWYLRQEIIWRKPNPMPESVRDRATKAHESLFLLTKSPKYYFDIDAPAWAELRIGDEDANGFRGGSYVQSAMDNADMGHRDAIGNKKLRRVPAGWDRSDGAHESILPEGRSRDVEYVPDDGKTTRNRRSVWTIASQPLELQMCEACDTIYGKGEYRELKRINIAKEGEDAKWRRRCRCGRHDAWLSHFATYPPDLIEPCIDAACPKGGIVLDPFGGAGTTGLVADRLQRQSIMFELNPKYAMLARYRIAQDRGGGWLPILDGDPAAVALYERHYSARKALDRRHARGTSLFVGPGQKLILSTPCRKALFAWRKAMHRRDGQTGIECTVFRNEGAGLSSDLIRAADVIADRYFGPDRHFSYVDPRSVASPHAGYCFVMADWRHCGRSKRGLMILERPAG